MLLNSFKEQNIKMKIIKNLFTIFLGFCFIPTIQAQDWPNLERYKKDNAQLETPGPEADRIVFMGNSITESWANDSLSFFKTKSYIGRGISGQTTPQMLIRFRPDVIDLKPSVVLILAGINDIAGNTGPSTIDMIVDNIKSMAELAKANNIKVVLCSVLPAYDFPWRKGLEPALKVVELNQKIKAFADDNEMIYLDYFNAMVDEKNGLKADLTYDGVHPNAKGYRLMEPLAEKAIEEALSEE